TLESLVYEKLELAFGYGNFGVMAEKLQIHRPGGTAHRFTKRLAHEIGNARNVIHVRVEFRRGLELREIFELLVSMAMTCERCGPATQRDDRRAREIRIL